MQVKGRYLVVAWTVVFLAAAGTIALRSRSGFASRARVDSLETTIQALESVRADISDSVSRLVSRPSLAPKVAALGLRHPPDSALIILRVPVRP
jgi:hypothetical protein